MDTPHPDCSRQFLGWNRRQDMAFAGVLLLVTSCSILAAGTGGSDPGSDCEFAGIDPQEAEVEGAWNGMTAEFGPGHALLDVYNPAFPTADTFHALLNRPAPALTRLCNGHMSNTLTLDVRPLPGDPPKKVHLDSLGCVDLIVSKVTAAVTRCPLCGDPELPKYPSHPEHLVFILEDGPLLDVRFEAGGDRAAADRFRAGVADGVRGLAHADTIEVGLLQLLSWSMG